SVGLGRDGDHEDRDVVAWRTGVERGLRLGAREGELAARPDLRAEHHALRRARLERVEPQREGIGGRAGDGARRLGRGGWGLPVLGHHEQGRPGREKDALLVVHLARGEKLTPRVPPRVRPEALRAAPPRRERPADGPRQDGPRVPRPLPAYGGSIEILAIMMAGGGRARRAGCPRFASISAAPRRTR